VTKTERLETNTRSSVAALAVLLTVATPALPVRASERRANADDAVEVARGQLVYLQHCARCHGANLEGEPGWRHRKPNGRMPAAPHDRSGHTWHHSDEALFRATNLGPAAVAGGA
jgi:mono/diheme cytochrome c family protein